MGHQNAPLIAYMCMSTEYRHITTIYTQCELLAKNKDSNKNNKKIFEKIILKKEDSNVISRVARDSLLYLLIASWLISIMYVEANVGRYVIAALNDMKHL